MPKSTPFAPIIALFFLFLGLSSLSPAAEPWFKRSNVGMEVGPTGAQFGSDPADTGFSAKFNGSDIVKACKKANCEYVVIWARDAEYAYYNSKIQQKCPGLGTRDPLREAVDEGLKASIPIIAYCVIQNPTMTLEEHPDWRMVAADGKPLDRVCFNSPYIDYMKRMTSEMLAYGIAGFHIDMIDQGFGPPYGCWCANCKRLYEEKYKHPMPKGVTWDDAWREMLDFRADSSARFEKDLEAHIRSVDPKATLDYNYHGNPPFSFEVGQKPVQHAQQGDFVTGETGIWGFSALGVGLNARFYAAATPGNRPQVAMQRGVRMYHDQTTRPLPDLRWELLTLLANGAFVTIVDKTAFSGALDPVAYDRIGVAFAEARALAPQWTGERVAEVGIYYSCPSRDLYGRETPANYQQSFLGAHKMLAYEHIPWDVILDENVSKETLKRFRAVIVPNAAILTPREIALFREYVSKGGNLIATGQTGLYDPLGNPGGDGAALRELGGGALVEMMDSLDNHVKLPAKDPVATQLTDGIRPDWTFLVKGPAAILKPTSATPVGELWRPDRTLRQKQGKEGFEWPLSAGSVAGPMMLLNTIGKGKVAWLACSPDAAIAGEHRVAEARLLLRNIVRMLVPDPEIEINAPLNVEAAVTDDAKAHTLRVHLIGYNAPAGSMPAKDRPFVLPSLIEDLPLFRATIKLPRGIKTAHALDKQTELKVSATEVTALVNDIHDVIEIELLTGGRR